MRLNSIPQLVLKPGREKSVYKRHPWIFSGAVDKVDPALGSGDLVSIYSAAGEFLGIASFSPNSQIRSRIWAFSNDLMNAEFDILKLIQSRLITALNCRHKDKSLYNTNSYRLIHGESDKIPGLIVDIYDDVAVVQFLSSGVERLRKEIVKILIELVEVNVVYERSDAEVRQLEGLPEREGLLYGSMSSTRLSVNENELKFIVDYTEGHKTGFYLDQRASRYIIRQYSEDKEVLDCFCYTGGFTLNALAGRATEITAIDSSDEALKILEDNIALNGFSRSKVQIAKMDVFKQLRLFRDQGKEFDLIILDPPKFAPTRKQVERAARGYKDINLLAMKLLRPNGNLFTFSCSGGVDIGLFQKIVAGAALDAEINLQIIEKLHQASDHPVLTSFPEGEYLKGLICRKL